MTNEYLDKLIIFSALASFLEEELGIDPDKFLTEEQIDALMELQASNDLPSEAELALRVKALFAELVKDVFK